MTQLAADLEVEYPDTQRNWSVDTFNMRYDIPTQQTRILFAMLQGSVLLVLLIACVNVTNLLLARDQERSREIALRTAAFPAGCSRAASRGSCRSRPKA